MLEHREVVPGLELVFVAPCVGCEELDSAFVVTRLFATFVECHRGNRFPPEIRKRDAGLVRCSLEKSIYSLHHVYIKVFVDIRKTPLHVQG